MGRDREEFMTKERMLALLLCAGLCVSGCTKTTDRMTVQTGNRDTVSEKTADTETDKKEERSAKIPSASGESSGEVMMVYMVGSNLESESGLASADIREMQESGFDGENLKVVICTGGSSAWWNSRIPDDSCSIFELTADGLTQIADLGDRSMADPDTLTDFIDYVYQAYSADQYSMVLWNHGGGAVLGYGADENYDYDALSVEDMSNAFAATKMVTDGEKFTWVGFDACLMGMIEVADMMSSYADYMIASEEMEAGDGWNYDFLKELSDGSHYDGILTAQCIIDDYADYYEKNYRSVPDYSLSCMDLSKTDAVIERLDAFVLAVEDELKTGGYSKIAKRRDQAKSFGKIADASTYDTVDLYDLCEKMSGLYPEQSKKLQGAIRDCVVVQDTNIDSAYGMAIYFPYENKGYVDEWLAAYSETGFSKNYIAFVKDFSATLSGEPIAEWNIDQVTPEADETEPGQYYVQLDEQQLATYGHATYQIWEEDVNYKGTYVEWLDSYDVSLSEDGKLSTAFDGQMFYLVDENGVSIRCCASEIERTDTYSKYVIPFMYSEAGLDKSLGVYAHVRVDAGHPAGELIGFYKISDASNGYFPEKNQVQIKDGSELYPFYFARKIVFNEDGSVAPFDQWKMNSGVGDTYKVSDAADFSIEMKPIDDVETEDPYCCLFQIADTQGNHYYTNPVYIEKQN